MSSRKMRLSAKVMVFSLALMIVLTGCEGMYSPRAPKDQDELAKKFEPEPKRAVIYVYRPKALEFPMNMLVKFRMDPGCISVVEFGRFGPRLARFNDTSYQVV